MTTFNAFGRRFYTIDKGNAGRNDKRDYLHVICTEFKN